MSEKLNLKNSTLVYIFLSLIFVLTIQIFDPFRGNAAHLIHSIKNFDTNKLQEDWIANQAHHLPVFVQFNYFLIKFFSSKVIYFIHGVLLASCALYLFLISKNLFPKLDSRNLSVIWFAFFIILFHENSFFSGVAGQSIIDIGYQPASFGILLLIGIYFFLVDKIFFSVLFICLGASFHPTYVLHSGFLISGILAFYIVSKNYPFFLKTLVSYIILILPITIFIIINFMMIDKNLTQIGQNIMFDRIPHHANIHYWFSYKDAIFLLAYLISLFLIRNNKRFFIFFIVFGSCSIFLSLFQYLLESKSLALAFPWRSSVIISPLSSVIIISFLIEKIKFKPKILAIFSYFLIITTSIAFTYKSHFVRDTKSNFKEKLTLTDDIKKNYDSIERLLVPTKLDFVRMYSGLPIFVDWKHPAFRYDQIILWKKRLDLADDFYRSSSLEEQNKRLNKIRNIEYISHVIIKKDQNFKNCEDLIDHDEYMLINVKECFNNNT